MFVGWYRDEALTQVFAFTTMPAEDLTFFAKWSAVTTNASPADEALPMTRGPYDVSLGFGALGDLLIRIERRLRTKRQRTIN